MHRHGTGDAFFYFAAEFWCVNRLPRLLLPDAAQQMDITGSVKSVLCAFAPGTAQTLQLRICQVKPVHRHDLRLGPERLQKLRREGGFTSAGRRRNAQHTAPPSSQQGLGARKRSGGKCVGVHSQASWLRGKSASLSAKVAISLPKKAAKAALNLGNQAKPRVFHY
jgi:hypothetical protein